MCEGHSGVSLLLSPQPMLSIPESCPRPLPVVMLMFCGLVQDGPREQLWSQIWGRSGQGGQEPTPHLPTPCLCPSVHPSLPSPPLPASAQALRSQGPKPAAPWCTLDPASWPLPLLGDLGSGLFLPGPLPLSPPQRMCSRPTTQSSKNMQPPRHLAQPLLAVASAEPVRSALPVRCQAWRRATQHPALHRVSGVPCASATDISAGDPGKRVVVVSIWQEVGLHPAGPGDFRYSG